MIVAVWSWKPLSKHQDIHPLECIAHARNLDLDVAEYERQPKSMAWKCRSWCPASAASANLSYPVWHFGTWITTNNRMGHFSTVSKWLSLTQNTRTSREPSIPIETPLRKKTCTAARTGRPSTVDRPSGDLSKPRVDLAGVDDEPGRVSGHAGQVW